jgi:hypothetical protein
MKLAAHPFMYHITSDVTNPTIKDESFLLLSRVSCSYTVLPPRDIVFHLPFSLSSSSLHTFRGLCSDSAHLTALAGTGDARLQAPLGKRYVTLVLCPMATSGKGTNNPSHHEVRN